MKLVNPEIRFEVTNRCNARCIMCPREKMMRPQGVMDLSLFKRVLDEAIPYGLKQVVLENYGESFCDPGIFEKAKYAKDKGLNVYSVTNASLIDEDACMKVLECFDRIRISMYAITKKTYERVHRGLIFEDVMENVMRLIRFRKLSGRDTPRIEMNYLLLDENAEELEKFLETFDKLVDAVSVWKPHNWADGRRYRKISSDKASCGRPFNGPLQVQWDGIVVPCCFDFDSKMVLGDLKTKSLDQVLKGDAYSRLRLAHQRCDFSDYPLCDLCDQTNKREDVLVYTTAKGLKVGATSSNKFNLLNEARSQE